MNDLRWITFQLLQHVHRTVIQDHSFSPQAIGHHENSKAE